LGRQCSVCEHPDRRDVEQRLTAGETLASIAASTGLNRMALSRHRRDHSPIWLSKVTQVSERSSGTVRERIEALVARIENVMSDAEVGRRASVVLQAARELRMSLETLGKLTGELDERPTTVVNVVESQEWREVQTALLGALAPFPQAKLAVVAALAPLGAS
jgi:hypothetical protein